MGGEFFLGAFSVASQIRGFPPQPTALEMPASRTPQTSRSASFVLAIGAVGMTTSRVLGMHLGVPE